MTSAATKPSVVVYATAPYSRHERQSSGYVKVPVGTVHAKTPGGAQALCGAAVGSWIKFFDLSFFRVTKERCDGCTSAALSLARPTSARNRS